MEREPNTIETRATEWVVRLDAGPLSAQEQQDFDTWLSADPRHHGAYIQAESNWLDVERWAAHRRASGSSKSVPVTRTRRYWALAAGAAALALVSAVSWYVSHGAREVYASAIGEVRNIKLADGSRLTLNTDTVATVQFKETRREISLQHGEALFEVAHDIRRPFVVRANDVEIKAIGTAFTVRIDDQRTDVLVTEGMVEVSREGPSGLEVRRVSAQEIDTLASPRSRPDIEPVTPEAVARKLAWREGKASFAGEPLSTAIAEINRHALPQLHVDDPALAAERVIGVFNSNDAEAFAKAVAATFNAAIVHKEDGIHLCPNKPAALD